MRFLAVLLSIVILTTTSFKTNIRAQTYDTPILRDMVFFVSAGGLVGILTALAVAATNPLSKNLNLNKNILIGVSSGFLAGAALGLVYLAIDFGKSSWGENKSGYNKIDYAYNYPRYHDNKLTRDLVHPYVAGVEDEGYRVHYTVDYSPKKLVEQPVIYEIFRLNYKY